MMDGRVVEVPVVAKMVDNPHYIGKVEGAAMKAPVCDLVLGNRDFLWYVGYVRIVYMPKTYMYCVSFYCCLYCV